MSRLTIEQLIDKYFLSSDYKQLADKTKATYKYSISVLCDTNVDGVCLKECSVKTLKGSQARQAYELWLERGIYMANHICAVSRKLYSFAMEMGYAETNPFATFRRKTVKPRKVVWSRDDLVKFLDTAYAEYKYRNVGLIAQMAYEWCQRVGDMRTLRFDNIDFDSNILNLEQSKRGANVHLPISEDLMQMLTQQKEDYGFQDYVVPYPEPRNGTYSPFSMERLSRYARQVTRLAGLPDELRIADLRRTGTTEMVEAGVSMGQIMSVTGHSNPSSVKPYMKNTYASAESALTTRKIHAKSTL
jgi:integrase